MKKSLIFFTRCIMTSVAICLLLFAFAGCRADDDEIVVFSDRFFFIQMTEIIRNLDDFTGRTIQVEGVFREFSIPTRDIYIVMRYIVCCEQKPIWFELVLGEFEPLPDDVWAEVVGTLAVQNGTPVLIVTSLTELEEHGQVIIRS